ncbi:branched-chain amino acid ABC transporter permease [Protaetiibacter larvae]|uniref:Branched-chain amino acid ABC transporter permease n=1 Tax=Protaetiibacter larvae TaxID=2592654 RepID=A0A5C1Y769_9MICO|nr:branched-chain amino acid ABC transporter permease [Protaetiibacter larvae]QEO09288.1 branched-chain amino acid ABC transporter permease [Protaetiibacter larvae]
MDFSFLFNNFIELTVTGLVLGSVYALIALGYTLVYGVLQLINFAHADVFMWGTFAVAWVFILTGANGSGTLLQALPYLLLALVVSASVSGGLAMLVERVAYRRLVRKRALSYIILISAIGASFVLSETMGIRDRIVEAIDGAVNAILGIFGGHVDLVGILSDYTARARGITTLPMTIKPETILTIGNFNFRNTDLTIILAALIMMVALDQFIRRTRLGREIRAVAQDPEAAALMGSNSTSVISKTFLIGGIMAGVAAVLYQIKVGSTAFDIGVVLGIKAFTAAVLGGIGNLRGALLGGLLLGITENYGSALFGTQWKDVVAFALLVLILLVRPTGLLGQTLGRARA